jgi:hypothetical protein
LAQTIKGQATLLVCSTTYFVYKSIRALSSNRCLLAGAQVQVQVQVQVQQTVYERFQKCEVDSRKELRRQRVRSFSLLVAGIEKDAVLPP